MWTNKIESKGVTHQPVNSTLIIICSISHPDNHLACLLKFLCVSLCVFMSSFWLLSDDTNTPHREFTPTMSNALIGGDVCLCVSLMVQSPTLLVNSCGLGDSHTPSFLAWPFPRTPAILLSVSSGTQCADLERERTAHPSQSSSSSLSVRTRMDLPS